MDYSDTTYHYNQVISANGEIKPLQGLEEKSFVYPWAAPMVIEIKPLQGLEENHFFMKEVQRTSISITSGATGGTINTIKRAPEGFNFLIDNL
jgi:hypothetical protein